MMQPLDTGDEQEVVFFEDLEDDDEGEQLDRSNSCNDRTKTKSNDKQQSSTINSNQIDHFQPLEQNTYEAVQATVRLESFLSSNDYDDSTTDAVRSNIMNTNVTRIFNAETTNDAVDKAVLNSPNFNEVRGETIHSTVVDNTNEQITGTNFKNIHLINSFDPYAPQQSINNTDPIKKSLFDNDEDDEDAEIITVTSNIQNGSLLSSSEQTTIPELNNHSTKTPGTVGFLEMEEEPPRTPKLHPKEIQQNSIYDPIQTSSGLLLTHRRIPPTTTITTPNPTTIPIKQTRFELDGTSSKNPRGYNNPRIQSNLHPFSLQYSNHYQNGGSPQSLVVSSFTNILRYVRLWVILSAIILLSGTVVLIHHTIQTNDTNIMNNNSIETKTSSPKSQNTDQSIQYDEESGIFHLNNENIQLIPILSNDETTDTEKIILLPLPETNNNDHDTTNNNNSVRKPRHRRLEQERSRPKEMVGVPALIDDDNNHDRTNLPFYKSHPLLERTLHSLHTLRADFDAWKVRHNKVYTTEQEHQYRFQIWLQNHHKTIEKNEKHGKCTITKQNVFGSNHLQDLTIDEFKSQYLNGYYLQRKPMNHNKDDTTTSPEHRVLGVHIDELPEYHPIVHERMMQQNAIQQNSIQLDYQGCKWYDVSCILRYIFSTFLYGLGGTMEPAYDANSYPTSIDWRSLGAVTEIHSQSSCGACWAITAVETVESAYFISTGKLYDLAETEVIVCETNCEMCAGGWPQDAFEYVIKHNGLPLESDMPYNADFLVRVSDQIAGNSDELDEETVSSYQQQTCPSGDNDKHSGDSESVSGSNTYTRYGKIKGYGYSTSKCVCYTDGSGCDCDHQNEGYAVRNLATYGPAVVCLDASTWQDYTGGIITSESGCSMGFMDVNHCVQAVGYAYLSDEDYEVERNENNSRDNKDKNSGSGSRDSTNRKGYWIIRNQWSTYWGMNGYAYVAMGENTCGILNDMMQAYT